MRQSVLVLFLLCTLMISTMSTKAATMPCSLVLEPENHNYPNARGVALIYKVKLTPSFPRTSVSIHALHLPDPTSLGNYDGYEGFSFIPDVISWRFKLNQTKEIDGPTWSGRIDSITAKMENVYIQVRPSNSKTEKLGPAILSNQINYCH